MNYLATLLFLVMLSSCGETKKTSDIFEEKEGVVAVEAEHFDSQSNDSVRKWYRADPKSEAISGDSDPKHLENASGNAFMEILPDSKTIPSDPIENGVNFTNIPGEMAVLHYKVYFNTPGKYFVLVRAFATGTEDNGLHVGLDGEWPESGHRMQWCGGKNEWTWESKQRTEEVHCGVPESIWLDITEPGEHTISFSMREDGFEFDKWMMSLSYDKPEGVGPAEVVH